MSSIASDDSTAGLAGITKSRQQQILSKKSTAAKEIEAWAWEGRESSRIECGRNSGHLSDNVTEERMLKTRIWEMSKERYRFLSKTNYDQKIFLDNQLRKHSIFKSMMNTDQLRKFGYVPESESAVKSIRRSSTMSSYQNRHSSNQRLAELKTDSAKRVQDVVPELPSERVTIKTRPQTVNLDTRKIEGSVAPMGQKRVSVSIPPKAHSEYHYHEQKPRVQTTASYHLEGLSTNQGSNFSDLGSDVKRISSVGFIGSATKQKHRKPTPSQDRRYQSLERCLCKNKQTRTPIAVSVVIQNNPSLYKPPRNQTKATRNRNVSRFLAELGIVS